VRALSIQVQPAKSRGLDLERLSAAFADIAVMDDLVEHHQFDRGTDNGLYLNFTFGTRQAAALWRLIRTRLYEDEGFGPHMRAASMAMCSGEQGWDEYLLLYHFDPSVKLDAETALSESI
jgi:hypothetical protein